MWSFPLLILVICIMSESVTVVSEEAGGVCCSCGKEMGQFEWEVDLQWEGEERSPDFLCLLQILWQCLGFSEV